MALPNINFIKGQGGLGRPLAGEDHISGLVFYSASLPSGFGANDRIKKIFSIEEAENLGIAKGSVNFGVFWYHINEFFRMHDKGILYVGIFVIPDPYVFTEIETMQNFADGKIRQIGVYVSSVAFATAQVQAIQAVAEDLEAEHQPLSVLYAGDISGVVDLSGLSDLRTLDSHYVSVIIGQDGANEGKDLFDTVAKSISCLGAALGAVSKAKVSYNIGWVGQFNFSELELDVPAFSNGTLVKNTSVSLQTDIDSKGYVFLIKHKSDLVGGTYANGAHTATTTTDDYATIENNRTIDKAVRNIRAFLLPALNSPLKLTDGKLSEDTIAYFETLAVRPLEQMEADNELSEFAVIINPEQNVLQTSKLQLTVKIVPLGVAREIEVNIGYTVKI